MDDDARIPKAKQPQGAGETASSESTAARLQRLLTSAVRSDGSREDMEEAARALVTELRQANVPPESMLLHIKRLLANAGLQPGYGDAPEDLVAGRGGALYRDVITLCIREYYTARRDGA